MSDDPPSTRDWSDEDLKQYRDRTLRAALDCGACRHLKKVADPSLNAIGTCRLGGGLKLMGAGWICALVKFRDNCQPVSAEASADSLSVKG